MSSDWKLLYDESFSLYKEDQYNSALKVAKKALIIAEQNCAADHLQIPISLFQLALIYLAQGKLKQAEQHLNRSLVIVEKTNKIYPILPKILIRLAELKRKNAQEEVAVDLEKRAADALDTLARIRFRNQKYDEAESFIKQSFTIRKETLGITHPDLAISLSYLADLYSAQNKPELAEQMFKHALSIRLDSFPADHPDIDYSYKKLAQFYSRREEYEHAENIYKFLLEAREKKFGLDHINVAECLDWLAEINQIFSEDDEAKLKYSRSLTIREKTFGPEHPAIVISLLKLANLYSSKSNYSEAEPLYLRALNIIRVDKGDQHPAVASIQLAIANMLLDQNHFVHAESLFINAHAVLNNALGENHQAVLESLQNVSAFYIIYSRYVRDILNQIAYSEELKRRAVELLKKVCDYDDLEADDAVESLYNGRFFKVGTRDPYNNIIFNAAIKHI